MDNTETPKETKQESILFIYCTECGREKEDPTLDVCNLCLDEIMSGHDGR